ncbi:hypothetical protein CBR59_30745 [Bacillus thuringiensis]|uniref:hypothetical protein n=1 Tax=Bacillus thuringiensis TaxID=1428 RepID=UPI000C9E1132|nr:hypothetical protein [Bacillus thuringiensis]PNK22557.1 hypothetical protein CBP87_31015 [Bacillus thuringiensis]PNK45543.1 hypothetical protein CBR59_30745 [Bacillus thuringiensis]
MYTVRIETIYQEILDGKRSKFPSGTWKEDKNRELVKRVTKYLIEEVLKWDREKLIRNWNQKLILRYKLIGALRIIYNNSPYAMINDLYPNRFKEWEFKSTPMNFWTKERGLEALRWTIEEREKLAEVDILSQYSYKWLRKKKLETPCILYFKNSPYRMLNGLYPNRFKEWQFKKTPTNFWTKEKALEALRWTIEEKENLTEIELLKVYTLGWLRKHNLSSPCQILWNSGLYEMINELYPGRFKEWQLKYTAHNFWTKKRALEALRWTIEEKENLTDKKIKEVFCVKWLTQKKLRTPLSRFWNDSPYEMINELYPGRFKEWELQSTPNNFWTREKAMKALKWTIEEKENLTMEQLMNVYSRSWLIENRLRTPLNIFWGNNTHNMLSEFISGYSNYYKR